MEEVFTLKIEKLLSSGAGLGRIGSMPVFVPDTAPEDTVKIKIAQKNKNYWEGCILEITEPSKYRVKPFCPYAKVCGSCTWQHIEYSEQLNQKKLAVKEAFKKIAGIEADIAPVIPSPKITEYRCKVQLPFSQTKVSKRLISGYYKKNSHELINIKYCPIQPQLINEINEFLKEEAFKLGLTGYNEKQHSGLIRHVIYRASSDINQILIIFVINSDVIDKKLYTLSKLLCGRFKQITGVCADFNTKKTNVISGGRTEITAGNGYYTENLGGIKYRVSAQSFFQVNPYCAQLIFQRVKELIKERTEKPVILDAYSGVSSFGIYLSDAAESVTCIEEVKSASEDAIENIKLNNIKNITILNGDAAEEFEKLVNSGVSFDISVTDPPRKGCSIEALKYLSKLTSKYIIYVSCNPSSLARDVKILAAEGFELEYLESADMFPHTPHIETIAVLKK